MGEVYGDDISWKEREDGNKDGRVEEGDRMGMGRRRIGWLGWQSCSVTTLLLPLINSPRFCRSYHCQGSKGVVALSHAL